MFAGGYSAGAGIANAMVYNTAEELQATYPSIVAELGNVNTSGNTLVNTFTIKGIFNNWGGVSSDFFDLNEAVPMVAFHGGNDAVVPIDSALDVSCFVTDHYVFGSHALYTKLTHGGICADLTVDLKGGHGVFQNAAGLLMRVNRATCFFKSLFCGSCSDYIATRGLTPNCAQATLLELSDEALPEAFTIYPNPSNAIVRIASNNHAPFTVVLTNPLGATVAKFTDPQQLDLTTLPNGIYLLQIKQGERQYTQKIVKSE